VFVYTSCSLNDYVDQRLVRSFPTRRSSDLSGIKCSTAGNRATHSSMKPPWNRLDHRVRAPLSMFARLRTISEIIGSPPTADAARDRKSTRLNSSHVKISYAVFCLKKKTKNQ